MSYEAFPPEERLPKDNYLPPEELFNIFDEIISNDMASEEQARKLAKSAFENGMSADEDMPPEERAAFLGAKGQMRLARFQRLKYARLQELEELL